MEDYFNNPANMHDFNYFNVKAIVNLKGSGCNIWEVFEVLDGVRRDIFRDIVFGYLLDVPRLQGDGLLFHKMFIHQIRPDPVLSPDGIKQLYFRVGNTKMIWIYEMLPAVRACGFVLRKNRDMPQMKRWSGTKKLKWVDVNKIFSKIQYVYGERKSVPSPVRDHFRRQDECSSSMSSSGRSHDRGRGSGKHNLDEVLKRLHALEQHVFMNRQPTEVFVEEIVQDEVMNKNNTTENIFGDIEDEKELEERNDNARNKFDDDVFDVNDYNEAKEVSDEDEVIITGNVDYNDDYGVDGKEVTPDKPITRKSSQYLCPPYTELHTTPKQKRRAKKKVDIKSTSPVPPPAFVVAHDFSVLRLQPYVAGDRDFWSALFGHTHDGWLESTVLLAIHSSPNHWLFGELRLASMEVHIYDSLGRVSYQKLKFDGTFTKFESRVANYLDKINYWARKNIPRIPLNMQFIYEENVPQQSSHLGDCGVFVCMFMEQLVSGQPIRELIDPKNATLEFRHRMAKKIWGSSLGPM
uniref:Ubiquitin-like protease family profile domain-containing protein n=1 Tax=Lactuca sativa TaxID=4236 RepID=A0A9R1VPJ0_LACSA|nr:hypothetical protein LSAT_V11C400183800 [Lactuca sativa]